MVSQSNTWIITNYGTSYKNTFSPNQRLSGKDDPPQINYFSGYHPVKKKGCLSDLHLSGLTLHPQSWPSLTSLSRKLQIRHGQRKLSPPRYSPSSVYPQNGRNISSVGIVGDPPIFWLKAAKLCKSEWKLEPASPSPCKLSFTKPQTSHLITLSWINKNSWAFLVSHGKADLWTNHKPCLSLFQDPFPLH